MDTSTINSISSLSIPTDFSSSIATLFAQSEQVLTQVDDAVQSQGDERRILELRSSVGQMVSSYTDAWPHLSPTWTSLVQEQKRLSSSIDSHRAYLTTSISHLQTRLYHPVHGGVTKLRLMEGKEDTLHTQMEHVDTVMDAIKRIQQIQQRIVDVTLTLDPQAIIDIEALLQSLLSLDPAMSQAEFFRTLQSEVDTLKERIIVSLLVRFQQNVHLERENGSAVVTVPPNLLSLLTSIYSLAATPRLMDQFTDDFLNVFSEPTLLEWSVFNQTQAQHQNALMNFSNSLETIVGQICGTPLIPIDFYRTLAPKLVLSFVPRLCDVSVPTTVAQYFHFSSVAEGLTSFQQRCHTLSLIPPDSNPLTDFIQAIHTHFTTKLRSKVLNQTKEGIMTNEFDAHRFDANQERQSLINENSTRIFQASTNYSISKSTYRYLELLYFVYMQLTEAYAQLSSNSSVNTVIITSIYTTLRDSLHLFISLSPVYRLSDLESILHMSFLYYNDCRFIAEHLAWMHQDLRLQLMKGRELHLDTSFMLIDLVSPLKQLGEKYFLLHLTRHRTTITELLDSLHNLNDLEEDIMYQQAKQSVKQTLHQLSSIEKIWHQVMGNQPPHKNGWSLHLGMLLEYLSSRLVAMVLEKNDISIEGASRMSTLFELITNQYKTLDPKYTPSWSCLQTLQRVLHTDQNLSKLTNEFMRGELNALTPEELSQLIRALYQDSSARTAFLDLLANATGVNTAASSSTRNSSVETLRTFAEKAGRLGAFASRMQEKVQNKIERVGKKIQQRIVEQGVE